MGFDFKKVKNGVEGVKHSFNKITKKRIEGIKTMKKKTLITTVVITAVVISSTAFYFLSKSNNLSYAKEDSKKQYEGFEQVKNEEKEKTSLSDEKGQSNSVAKVVENVMPAIVAINTETASTEDFFGRFGFGGGGTTKGSGSGFIFGQNGKNILIATNNHVVEGANSVSIAFCDNSKDVKATVKGVDKKNDIAVVCVDMDDMESSTKDAIRIANLGDSKKCKVGEMAIAIGNALGYGQSVTVGVVSATERQVVSEDEGSNKCIQTDAAINPGNSGGALLNSKGEVIGINSIKYVSDSTEGMGYAIPIARAEPILQKLAKTEVSKNSGEPAHLGIVGRTIEQADQERFNMPKGVYISKVSDDSPAQKAGLQKGDIITKLDGSNIDNMSDIEEVLSNHKAGDNVEIVVKRESDNYKEQKLEVTLGSAN